MVNTDFSWVVWDQCGGRSQGGHKQGRNKDVRGQYLGCFGDGCANRDERQQFGDYRGNL